MDARQVFEAMIISIHAPARGAMVLGVSWYQFQDISIHAPARGAMITFIINH